MFDKATALFKVKCQFSSSLDLFGQLEFSGSPYPPAEGCTERAIVYAIDEL